MRHANDVMKHWFLCLPSLGQWQLLLNIDYRYLPELRVMEKYYQQRKTKKQTMLSRLLSSILETANKIIHAQRKSNAMWKWIQQKDTETSFGSNDI